MSRDIPVNSIWRSSKAKKSKRFWARDNSSKKGDRYPLVPEETFERFYGFPGNVILDQDEKGMERGAKDVQVWMVEKLDIKVKFAAKTIQKNTGPHADEINKELYREIDVLKALSSSNVTQFFECYNEPYLLYIIMELVQGITLTEKVKKDGQIAEETVKVYAHQIFLALQHCHERGVVHRDIKPDNIMVNEDIPDKPKIKLIDFGLSRIFNLKHFKTKTMTRVCFTPGYGSPQIYTQKPYSYKTDYWSTGVTLYRCLTGKRPFDSTTEKTEFERIVSCDFTFEVEDWEKFDPNCQDLVSQLIVIEEAKRPDATEALMHPWFDDIVEPEVLNKTLNRRLFSTGYFLEAVDEFKTIMGPKEVSSRRKKRTSSTDNQST